MDDILKRMLAVEQQADRIVREANATAEQIMEEGRRKANEITADAQVKLAAEVDAMVQKKVDEALVGKAQKLAEADKRMEGQLAEFRQKTSKSQPAIVKALLFPGM